MWATSLEAEFLGSGRFIWAHWDVDELKQIFVKIGKGEIEDEVLHDLERDLDLEEVGILYQRGDDSPL